MFDEVASGHIGQFSICAPPGYIGWRNHTDNIAFLEAGDGCTNRFDDARRLEPEAAGKVSLLQIGVRAKHDLRSIEADALYIDLDFVGTWRRNIEILDLQYACITIFVEANDACHDFSSTLLCSSKSSERDGQRPFNAYFLSMVRSRNSIISDPIRSPSSSSAK